MAVPTADDPTITIQVSGEGSPPVRDRPVPERVISVLLDTGLEEWRRGWNRSPGSGPRREAIVSANELTRGATATTQVAPDARLAYTILGAPVEVDRLIESIADHLDGAERTDLHLIVDNVSPLIADQGIAAVEAFIAGLRERLSESVEDVVIGCSVGDDTDPMLAAVFDLGDTVEGVNPVTANDIECLRRDDPTTFGYLRRHWAEAQRGIDACNRNYPQSKQVHAAIANPETTPRTLGAALSGLVTLNVLGTWSETVGPTRYDLTAYRPGRMWDVGLAFAGSQEAEKRVDSTEE